MKFSWHKAAMTDRGITKEMLDKLSPASDCYDRYTKMVCKDYGEEKPCVRVRLTVTKNEKELPVGTEGNVIEGTMEHSGMLRVLFDNGMNIPCTGVN